MSEPTPIRKRVDGRSKRVKLAAVMAAEMSGVVQASRQTGIPESSIRVWRDRPEFAEIRANTREELAQDVKVAAILLWKRIVELIPEMEARDAIFAGDKAVTLMQLLSGEATSRSEHRELLADFDDHETDVIRDWLHEQARDRADLPTA